MRTSSLILILFFLSVISDSNAEAFIPVKSFGDEGSLHIKMRSNVKVVHNALELKDGRILVVGQKSGDRFSSESVAIVLLTEKGDLDASFAENGKIHLKISQHWARPDAALTAAQQDDGKILVGGTYTKSSNGLGYAAGFVLRLTLQGALDNSFGKGGIVRVEAPIKNVVGIGELKTGKIILVGESSARWPALVQLQNNGEKDTSFGDNGLVTIRLHQFRELATGAGAIESKVYTGQSLSIA